MLNIIIAILVFSIVIFVHEFGHFIAAKKSGVKVNEFAIGMGPAIFKKQYHETLYAIRVFPIGGYCAMEGEDEESDDNRSFEKVSAFKRLIIIVAGAFMNFLFAFLICVLMQMFTITTVTIGEVQANTPAFIAGLQQGDKISEINGKKIESTGQVQQIVRSSEGKSINYKIDREGQIEEYQITPQAVKDENSNETNYQIGVVMEGVTDSSLSNFSIIRGIKEGFVQFTSMVGLLFKILGMLFTGQLGVSNLAGPIGVVNEIGKAADSGLMTLLFFIAYINVNLGILNLLPFPALDGGRAILILIEIITGKKLPKEKEALINGVGLALLLGLILFVSIQDVRRLF